MRGFIGEFLIIIQRKASQFFRLAKNYFVNLRITIFLQSIIIKFINYIKYNGFKKIFVGVGSGIVVSLITLFLVANYFPGHLYKDSITIGEVTITSEDIAENEAEEQAYIKSHPIVEPRGENSYDSAADDMILNAALKDQAKKCGVSDITHQDILNEMEIDVPKGKNIKETIDETFANSGNFARIRQENELYKDKLFDCTISQREYFLMEVLFDKEYFWNINNADNYLSEINQVGEMLNREVIPLFEQGLTMKEIAAYADDSYGIFGDLWEEDHAKTEELFKRRPVLVAETINSSARGYYSEVRDGEAYPGMPDLDSLPSANQKLAELKNVGDYTEPFYSKSDIYMIGRLERVYGGEHVSWDSFLGQYKEKYAYHEISDVVYTVKNVAAQVFNWVDSHFFGSVFAGECDSTNHNYAVKIYTVDWDSLLAIEEEKIELSYVRYPGNLGTCGSGNGTETKWALAGNKSNISSPSGFNSKDKGQKGTNIKLTKHSSNGSYGSSNDPGKYGTGKYFSNDGTSSGYSTGVSIRHNCNKWAPVVVFNPKAEKNKENGVVYKGMKTVKDSDNKKLIFVYGKGQSKSKNSWYTKHKVGTGKGNVILQWANISGAANNAQEARLAAKFKVNSGEPFQPVATSEASEVDRITSTTSDTMSDTVNLFESNLTTAKIDPNEDRKKARWPFTNGDNVKYVFEDEYSCIDNITGLPPSSCNPIGNDEDGDPIWPDNWSVTVNEIPSCWDYSNRKSGGANGTVYKEINGNGWSEDYVYGWETRTLPQCFYESEVDMYATINACVSLYGPFTSPATRKPSLSGNNNAVFYNTSSSDHTGSIINNAAGGIRNNPATSYIGNLVDKKCGVTLSKKSPPGSKGYQLMFDNSTSVKFTKDGGFSPGYYYYVVNINRNDQEDNNAENYMLSNEWYSPFAEETETTISPFQPYATSKVESGDKNNGKYVVPGQTVKDVLTYKATDTIENANRDQNQDDNYWLRTGSSVYAPVNFCVTAYGPYQNPQSRINNLPDANGKTATSGSLERVIPASYNSTNKKQTICQTANGPSSIKGTTAYNFNTNNWEPGYYYFLTTVNKDDDYYNNYLGASVSGTRNQNSTVKDLMVGNWISEFNPNTPEDEWGAVQFQPYATSTVPNGDGDGKTYVHTGDTIHDVLTIKNADSIENANNDRAAPATHWPKNNNGDYVPINYCVTAYGPYQQPQNTIKNSPTDGSGADTSGSLLGVPANSYEGFDYSTSAKKATICHTATKGPTSASGETISYDFKTNGWTPGYYYFLTTVNKSENEYNDYFGPIASGNDKINNRSEINGLIPTTKINDLMIGGWISKFNPNDTIEGNGNDEDEWAMVQFQPYITSEAPVIWVNDGESSVTDKLTSHVGKNSDNAEDGYQSNNDLKAYWPKDRYGKGEVATICTVPFGPYQNAQEAQSYATGTSEIPKDGDNKDITVGQASKALCIPFDGPEQTKDYTFDTFGWEPGYYYFMSYFRKGSVKSTDPFGVQHNDNRPVFYGDWTSIFNPESEKESVVDKFQLKVASKTKSADTVLAGTTINTNIPSDTSGHSGNEPDGVVNGQDSGSAVTVLKPTDTYIEDSLYIRAYDTNEQTDISDKNDYWLKDSNNKYLSFRVCANVYGPYQKPQPRALANNLAGSTLSPGSSVDNNYLTNNKDPIEGREQCFWTDTLQGQSSGDGALSLDTTVTDGLVAKPSASGGPGEYKLRWQNDPTGDNYFQPGYYYIVWNVQTNSTNSTDSDQDPDSTGNCDGTANDCTTTVELGEDRVTRRNGDFLESDWWSPFGEQSESFYAQFQPVAKSTIPEYESTDNNRISGRTKSEGNEGIVMECDENKYNNTINYSDGYEEYPREKLQCHKVTDNIYLGAVNNEAIDSSTAEVDVSNNDDLYWPKNKDGLWETVKFQVKLYGPFANTDTFDAPDDDSTVGKAGGVQISTVSSDVYAAQGVYAQPVAESCVITTNPAINGVSKNVPLGPNWGEDNKPYEAIFTQDFGSCNGNNPTNTAIELSPGIYTSVVEIVRDDEQTWPVKYNSNYDKNGTASQSMPMHNMLIKDRFTSNWGDPKETLMVPIPLYIVTRRDNSAEDTFIDQVTINDQYWINGFSAKYVDKNGNRVPWKDIFGKNIPEYGDYKGDPGYFNADETDTTASHVSVDLFGPYPLADGRPNEDKEYCRTDRLVDNGRWVLPAEDTGDYGRDLPYPAPLTLYEKGWYIFQYTYNGGERISNIKTGCGDTNEMFRIIKDDIGLVTAAKSDYKTAPTRVTDTVVVTGNFTEDDKNSIVKLNLYKSARGKEVRPGITGLDGEPLCTVIFPINSSGTYSTSQYINSEGYALDEEQDVIVSGRCFAEDGGHYYWIEEFLRPGSNYLEPTESDYIQPIGTGKSPEDLNILPPTTPKVTTDADPATSINQPFRDTALVEDIPEGSTEKYQLYFEAYGPNADGQISCDGNLIYSNQSEPIIVTKNGEYYSDFITVSSNGLVYWVEHLLNEEGEVVDEGTCGISRETTYVVGQQQANSFDPFEVTFSSNPLYPDAGYFTRQLGKVVIFGLVSMLGAWQLTDKNSWLLRKRQ